MTAEPDSIYIRRSPATDDFLVVACDGLWDVMSNEQACSIVYGFLKKDNVRTSMRRSLWWWWWWCKDPDGGGGGGGVGW